MTFSRDEYILENSRTGLEKVPCIYFLPICYWKTVVLIEITIILRRYSDGVIGVV